LGKRPLVRRRGRGGNQFRSTSTGKLGTKAIYPNFPLSEQHEGTIIDLVHERGREAPLAKIRFEDGSISFVPAILGAKVGTTLQFVLKSELK
jgi:large subunit ribosomal protein L2